MREIIRRTRDLLVSTPDTVCLERARLATQGYTRWADEPIALRRALTFQHILENMTLDLHTNPIFAGNTSTGPRAWMILPEYGFNVPEQAMVENDSFTGFLDGNVIPRDLREFWATRSLGGGGGVGHLAVNMERVVSEGLECIIAEAESHPDDYRRAMAVSCRAVIGWAQRYVEEARRMASRETDSVVRTDLLRVAEACDHVPGKPARSLFEALQAIALVHLAIHIEGHGYSVSLGLLDRILARYDPDPDATELLAAFLLKIAANSLWGSHSKTQAITLGGLDHEGNDRCNDITLRFLDACNMVRMPDPHMFIRWHEKINPAVKAKALELLGSGLSMPLLVGDEQTAQGFIGLGIPPEDAWDYCVIGCNELGIPGKMADSATGPLLEDLALLNDTLLGLESPDSVRSMDDLLGMMRDRMGDQLRTMLPNAPRHRAALETKVPTPFTSALMDGCIGQGRDMHAWMQYSRPCIYERGFTNTVNGLAAIEKVVFQDRAITLGQLVDAMKSNFADDSIRSLLLEAPKWGNDDDRADKWASVLMQMRQGLMDEIMGEISGPPRVVCHVVRSLHHIDGRRIGASPDGRRAGTPVAEHIGPHAGTMLEGPTAMLNSVLKLKPAEYWRGGYNLNLTISAQTAGDPLLRDNLLAMVEAFFADGGQELQIACLDASMLRDAKAHPEKYPDLLVRIAGFNALFAKLSSAEQDELIARAETGL